MTCCEACRSIGKHRDAKPCLCPLQLDCEVLLRLSLLDGSLTSLFQHYTHQQQSVSCKQVPRP